MTPIHAAIQRFRDYGWAAHLFIFVSPVYALDDISTVIADPDFNTVVRYLVHVILGWVVIELISQSKESKETKKPLRKTRTPNTSKVPKTKQ